MILVWAGFTAFVLLMLALDLGVFHRKAHAVSLKEAMGWSAVWIFLGLAFSIFIYFGYGTTGSVSAVRWTRWTACSIADGRRASST